MLVSIMQGIKYILLIVIFGLSTGIGILISKSYENRVIELKEFKNILNIMKTKIKFTYEPLAEIFKQISKDNQSNVEKIFGQMANQIAYYPTIPTRSILSENLRWTIEYIINGGIIHKIAPAAT